MTKTPSLFPPKVFDTSSLISIEKAKRMAALRARKDEVLVPRRVAKELSDRESPLRRFLRKNRDDVVTDLRMNEERRYLELLKQPGIDPGEAAAIAICEARELPLVINDGVPRKVATKRGIRCLGWKDFVNGAV